MNVHHFGYRPKQRRFRMILCIFTKKKIFRVIQAIELRLIDYFGISTGIRWNIINSRVHRGVIRTTLNFARNKNIIYEH